MRKPMCNAPPQPSPPRCTAHNFINDVSIASLGLKSYATDATNAAAAGFVLLSITNFALLIVIGLDQEKGALGYGSDAQHFSSPV